MLLPMAAGAASGAGSSAGEELRLARTARDLAMGDAQVATGSGGDALASNPAGLLDTKLLTLHLTHVFQAAETQQEYFAWAQRLPFGPAFGAGLFWLYNGGMTRTMEDTWGAYAGEAGKYAVGFLAVSAGCAIDLKPLVGLDLLRPSAGVVVRAFGQQVDDSRDLGLSADLGLRIRPGLGFVLGGVLQNAGRKLAGADLPRQFVGAVGWEMAPLATEADALTVEADMPFALDKDTAVRFGAEYAIGFGAVTLAFRGGMMQGVEVPDVSGFTFGLGFRNTGGSLAWGLDYTGIPFGPFGYIQAIALTAGFAPPQ